jgi:protein gp37
LKLGPGHPQTIAAALLALWLLIRDTRHLDWQLLTKRPENILRLLPPEWRAGLPRNVGVGTSISVEKP